MTGFDSKRKAALDEEGMYLVHHTAQPEQEPVADALIRQYITALVANKPDDATAATKAMVDYVYTTPPQRPWVGLTDEEIKEIVGPYGETPIKGYTRQLFDQIEAKLREKNHG